MLFIRNFLGIMYKQGGENMENLSNKLKDIRKSNNLTMEELAKLLSQQFELNVTKGMISRWEGNKSEPMSIYLRAYSKAFNISLDYLLGVENDISSSTYLNGSASIGQRIKEKRIERNMTLEEVGKIAGVSRATIQRYESGTISNIPSDRIERIAKALKTTPAYLMGWEDDSFDPFLFDGISPIETKKIPMLGEIACGEPILCNEDRESYVLVGTDIRADFCLRCKGDSMINARIFDGDIVFVRKQDTVENGEIAVVVIDDEATLKRFYYYPESGKIELKPENPKYNSLIYLEGQRNDIHILGKAIAFQADVV